jgi:predicted small lipoprotein YifL
MVDRIKTMDRHSSVATWSLARAMALLALLAACAGLTACGQKGALTLPPPAAPASSAAASR